MNEELGMYTDSEHIKYSDDHIVNKKPYEVVKIQEDLVNQVGLIANMKCFICKGNIETCGCDHTKAFMEIMKSQNLEVFNEKTDPIVESVRKKLLDRSQVGIKKYNTTLEENKKDNFLNHAQEEALDLANYLEVLMQQDLDIIQLCIKFKNDLELGSEIRKIYGK